MQLVIDKPPVYKAIQWTGSNADEFTENLSGVTTALSDTTVVLIQNGAAVTVAHGWWFVYPESATSITSGLVTSDEAFQANYMNASVTE